ncbi:MAG TPA: protein kinase [Vicinamibacterales bacterium]
MLSPGTRLGSYEIRGLLGSGGMGEVYRAHDARLRREVAIKILPRLLTADAERVSRFEREAHLLAALNHPNIAAIHGIEEYDGVPALILELVEGETLSERIARGPLPLGETLMMARQIADALHAAHGKGIVHRDLKPANIKITPAKIVKVLDFGLAKMNSSSDASSMSDLGATTMAVDRTQAGMILGTAAYMSPEQARGHTVDTQTDVWAFGCVLFEMLTGRPAFGRATVTDTLAAIVHESPDFERLPSTLPPALVRMLKRCLEKDPARRFHDIADVSIELEDIARESANGTSPVHHARPQRRRLGLAAAAAVSVVLFGAAVVIGISVLRPREEPKTVTRVSISAPGPVTPQSAPAVSPDGRRIAFAAKDAAARTMLWVRDLDALQPRALPETDDAAHPFWSPDGKSIGFLAAGQLKRVDVADGSVRVLANQPQRIGDTWGDGVILYPPQATNLAVMPASGGSARPIGITGAWPFFLPDGHHFLYQGTNDGKRGLSVGSIDSGQSTFVVESDFRGMYAAPGFLLTTRDETLMAFPFDVEHFKVTGEPFVAADGVFSVRGASQASFSVSPAGVLAYVNASITSTQFAAFDRSGRPLGPIAQPERSFNQAPRLSPSGRQLVMARGRWNVEDSVWLFDVATGRASRLSVGEGWSNSALWSRDGSRVLYASAGRNQSGVRIGVTKVNGEGQEETLFSFPAAEAIGVWDWSPDGRYVVYSTASAATKNIADLWVLPLEGERKPRPYLQSGFHKTQAQVSPNGQWLAYTSFESGKDEVYVQSFPTAGSKHQVSVDGGMQPRWRPDGSELFFLDRYGKMTVVPVKADGGFEAGPPATLFQTKILPQGSQSIYFFTAYDVSPDGQRFFINGPADDPGPPITVVFNWAAAKK